MAHMLKVKNKNGPNKDGSMDATAQKEYLKKYEAELITPEEAAKWTRGASNAGYHYLGCAKTFALMGKSFAEANLEMMKGRP
jgi:alpha-galactosidase